ncbi:hypothetical protein RIF29_42027 [Crotalaria pallida]|uniref:Uncharacterized protein n=1 Tax=Crotalaria pallida TaxID=3830 RepID=A0AAN9EBP4_CROPI
MTSGHDTNNCSIIKSRTLPYEDATATTTAIDGLIFVRCEKRVKNKSAKYLDISEYCRSSERRSYYYSYALTYRTRVEEVEESCSIEMKVIVRRPLERITFTCNNRNCAYPPREEEINNKDWHAKGIELRWIPIPCEENNPRDPTWEMHTLTKNFTSKSLDLYQTRYNFPRLDGMAIA